MELKLKEEIFWPLIPILGTPPDHFYLNI